MNVKTLRKNYKTLNLIERHSLLISAIMRNDKSEEAAVLAASPTQLWEIPDFSHLYQKVLSLLMIVIINKADAWTNWQLFGVMENQNADEHSRLALYFFFVYADAWAVICNQLKIDGEKLAEMTFPNNFIIWRIAQIDEDFRKLAFTEDEARDFVTRFTKSETGIEMTLKNKIEEFRKFLDLPEK